MAKILVYNNDTNRVETYFRGEREAMPYNINSTLIVGEFRGSSSSPTLWTTKATMQAWNQQRRIFGAPIPVGYAFKRPWEGGHGLQSQHYAGVAFDAGQILSNTQRNALRNSAINSGLWTYVEPASLTPTWVNVLLENNITGNKLLPVVYEFTYFHAIFCCHLNIYNLMSFYLKLQFRLILFLNHFLYFLQFFHHVLLFLYFLLVQTLSR